MGLRGNVILAISISTGVGYDVYLFELKINLRFSPSTVGPKVTFTLNVTDFINIFLPIRFSTVTPYNGMNANVV